MLCQMSNGINPSFQDWLVLISENKKIGTEDDKRRKKAKKYIFNTKQMIERKR